MRRFLHVTTFYPPYSFGGDGAYVRRLAHALADQGHLVDVVHSLDAYHVLHPAEPEIPSTPHPGVTVHGLRSGMKWLTTLAAQQTGRPWLQQGALRRILNSQPYDVVHFHNVSLFGPGVLALNPDGPIPLKVYTTHEHWLVCPMHVLWKFGERACEKPECMTCTLKAGRPPQWWRYTDLLTRATAHVDLFLAPSRFVATMHAERGFERHFDVLPLFVDDGYDDWQEAPAPHPRPYLLFVGRIERMKGLEALIRAAAEGPAVDLLVAGDGSDLDRLRALAATNPRVHFLGAVPADRLGPLFGHALACCVPSETYEVFPTVAIESLARKTPVVAHDIGGLTEIIQDSGGGILYRTHEELVAALYAIVADEDARRAMGERGYRMVTGRWSKRQHLAQYLTLLDATTRRRATPH